MKMQQEIEKLLALDIDDGRFSHKFNVLRTQIWYNGPRSNPEVKELPDYENYRQAALEFDRLKSAYENEGLSVEECRQNYHKFLYGSGVEDEMFLTKLLELFPEDQNVLADSLL